MGLIPVVFLIVAILIGLLFKKKIVTAYFDKRTVSHSAVVSKLETLRKPKINWIDFLNIDKITTKLSSLTRESKPVFGKMNGQQVIEHLSLLMQISNGKIDADYFVSDEKTARRKPFLDSERELHIGFRASILSDDPNKEKFDSIQGAIKDLVIQIQDFEKHFKKSKLENHPFFGELDYEYWKKFHVKHFTHHFKQFNLL